MAGSGYGWQVIFSGGKKQFEQRPSDQIRKTFSPGLSLPQICHPSQDKISKHFPSGPLAWLLGNPYRIPHPHFTPSKQARKKLSQAHIPRIQLPSFNFRTMTTELRALEVSFRQVHSGVCASSGNVATGPLLEVKWWSGQDISEVSGPKSPQCIQGRVKDQNLYFGMERKFLIT